MHLSTGYNEAAIPIIQIRKNKEGEDKKERKFIDLHTERERENRIINQSSHLASFHHKGQIETHWERGLKRTTDLGP